MDEVLLKRVHRAFEYFKPFGNKPKGVEDVFKKVLGKDRVYVTAKYLEYYKYLCIYHAIYNNYLSGVKIFPSYFLVSLYLEELEDIEFDFYSVSFKFGVILLNSKVFNKQENNIIYQFCDYHYDKSIYVIEFVKGGELALSLSSIGFNIL